jgi:hypothetical protein
MRDRNGVSGRRKASALSPRRINSGAVCLLRNFGGAGADEAQSFDVRLVDRPAEIFEETDHAVREHAVMRS